MATDDEQEWMELYRSALMELDPTQLPHKIIQAHQAIQRRIDELLMERNITEEHLALEDALRNLRTLRRQVQ